MANPDLVNLFYCIITLFFLFRMIQFIVEIILYYKNKSLGNKINNREIIVSTWLLLPFIISYGSTILIIRSFKELKVPGFIIENDYWMIFGFLIGLVLMITIFVITVKIRKGKRYVIENLNTDVNQEDRRQTLTSNLEILESDNEVILMHNSTTNNDVIFADLTNDDNTNQDNLEINTLDKANNLKLSYSSQKKAKNTITPILRKNSPVIPDNNADDIILEKFYKLKAVHGAYCNYDDFKNLLSNITVEKKILFTDKYLSPIKSKKTEFLRILNDILDGNIVNHPNKLKLKHWIEESFDSDNFEGEKISDVDISRFK